jgi:transglutaminase-like putative cysteine protease
MASALSDAGQHLEQALFAIEPFRRSTAIIDWQHPDIVAKASALRGTDASVTSIARRCFEWVRDEIKHSHDHGLRPVTCVASDVLRVGSGYCYAKSHFLAALLRANGLAAGFCYQRLSRDDNGPPFCLHGLNGVWLPDTGWYRIDARGNRPGVNAQFTPPVEQLAYSATIAGEADLFDIRPDPLPIVVETLIAHSDARELWTKLPDVDVADWQVHRLS